MFIIGGVIHAPRKILVLQIFSKIFQCCFIKKLCFEFDFCSQYWSVVIVNYTKIYTSIIFKIFWKCTWTNNKTSNIQIMIYEHVLSFSSIDQVLLVQLKLMPRFQCSSYLNSFDTFQHHRRCFPCFLFMYIVRRFLYTITKYK